MVVYSEERVFHALRENEYVTDGEPGTVGENPHDLLLSVEELRGKEACDRDKSWLVKLSVRAA